MKKAALLIIILTYAALGFGQITPPGITTDSTYNNDELISSTDSDSVKVQEIQSYASKFVPRKASLYAAVLPGLGQIYNKDYWKLPIVYGGFIGFGLTVKFWNDQHSRFRSDLFALLETGEPSPDGLTEQQLRNLVDDARRERDFYMIMTGVFYLLQIAEAHISAHLKEFKLNPDLRVKIEPKFEQPQYENYRAGLAIKLRF
ncbi:hypothetical protein FNH22_01805 [Fulvivirga sp. M361]|uniref:DUF5683 domain-containing protein n=1 Tax=Fulvivirga sp. M361 TaxID=2594266 RepID=UPI00117B27C2|nr:DUF5683 domain-containing protein [Fulvivirga sp. M361]TRX62079.1 hypothetical protein FNH22_01805 [Fulvivirga sp. M361]